MGSPSRRHVAGSVLFYDFVPPDAGTIMDHVTAFTRYSRHPVWAVNLRGGYPRALDRLDPSVVILHYSLFGSTHYPIPPLVLDFLDRTSAYKVAFFQDEFYYRPQRIAFLNDHSINGVYSLVEPPYHEVVYGAATSVRRVETVLPGYVNDRMIKQGAKWAKQDPLRRIDIGYRARRLLAHWGRGAQEKAEIGERFKALASGTGLLLDIEVENSARIYGSGWYRFLGDCRAVLGVESGVSVFDLDDSIRLRTEALLVQKPQITFDELSDRLLGPYENNVPYRTVSPRHFEAAATRSAQILYEGTYSNVLEPMRHYIPLRKNFSNFDEVVRSFRDTGLRQDLVDRAFRDLIASGKFTYQQFIAEVDDVLEESVDDLVVGRSHWIGFVLSASQAPGMMSFRFRLTASGHVHNAWDRLPHRVKAVVRPVARRVLRAARLHR